ncbi:MAG TPA: hydantoinase/oxoprolinase family protein [Actinomycetota bacterium]
MPAAARVGIDVGGTFTDVVLIGEDGSLTIAKVPSTAADQSEGFVAGIAAARAEAGDPPLRLIAHGTTVATNAVLERRGARTALLTTDGFRDLLIISRQQRPSLYDLTAVRPEPIVPRELAAGVPERVGRDGEVLVPLDEEAARAAIARLDAAGAESVAVCLLFSFAAPAHEHRLRALIEEAAPGTPVSLSSDVLPEFREYERASTTALDAYVGPVMKRYVRNLRDKTAEHEAPVVVMRSGGGTMSAETAAREPVHTLLSGPAAGVRGATLAARAAGFHDIVSFDMGGTSTDVCLVENGEPAIGTEASIGGLPFRTPSLAVHTVGAGGGSVLWIDEAGALRAGPRSAGAVPGPASYGRGGTEPALTDAHVALGHIDPGAFLGGRMRLDVQAAAAALGSVAAAMGASSDEVARAGLAAARAAMSAAIRVVTVERGRDPRAFVLVGFGGAGPMHATALADELSMTTVLIPPASGVLSALGLLAAPLTADVSRTMPMVEPDAEAMGALLDELSREAAGALLEQGSDAEQVRLVVDLRYLGQAHEVGVDAEPIESLPERFHVEHRARFGWDARGEPVELVTFRARASGPEPSVELPVLSRHKPFTPPTRAVDVGGERVEVPAWNRASLGGGAQLQGPCVIDGEESTTLIDPGWVAEVDQHGSIVAVKR